MAKKIYRIFSWSLLALVLISFLLILRNPSISQVETSPQAAQSFDRKIAQVELAHQRGTPQETRITEAELNSKLQESFQVAPSAGGPAQVKGAVVRVEGDKLVGTFIVNLSGKDVYVTIAGTLGAVGGQLQFTPTEMKMGSLPIPLAVVDSTLRDKLNAPEMRERMRLPEFVKDVRIENGELVLEAK